MACSTAHSAHTLIRSPTTVKLSYLWNEFAPDDSAYVTLTAAPSYRRRSERSDDEIVVEYFSLNFIKTCYCSRFGGRGGGRSIKLYISSFKIDFRVFIFRKYSRMTTIHNTNFNGQWPFERCPIFLCAGMDPLGASFGPRRPLSISIGKIAAELIGRIGRRLCIEHSENWAYGDMGTNGYTNGCESYQ